MRTDGSAFAFMSSDAFMCHLTITICFDLLTAHFLFSSLLQVANNPELVPLKMLFLTGEGGNVRNEMGLWLCNME